MKQQILKRTAVSAINPISLSEAKLDCRVDHDAEDSLIESLISAATAFADAPNGVIGKALISQQWALSVKYADRKARIHLPVTPAVTVDSITYFDPDNAQKSLVVEDFYLYGDEDWAYIEPKVGVSWPATADRLDAITVTYTAGFGDAGQDVPATIRQLIRLMVVHWYTNRSAVDSGAAAHEVPMAAQSLISINRKGWVY